jgi:peptidoglycan/LPS O-acetylase OafA/YrhL
VSRSSILGHFYLRRALRLLPVFYVTLAVLVALDILDMRESWPWHAAYLSNVYAFWTGNLSIFWTLAVEEQFYLLWPLLLMVTPRRWTLALAFGMIAASTLFKIGWVLSGAQNPYSYTLLFSNMDLLGAGAVLAILSFRDRSNDFAWLRRRSVATGFAALALVCMVTAVFLWWRFGSGHVRTLTLNLTTGVFYGWLVACAAKGFTGWLGAVGSFAPLRYIGRISYGIYVIHNFLPHIVRHPAVQSWTGELSRGEMGLIVVPLAFLLPALSWHLMERPIQRLKDRIGYDEAKGIGRPGNVPI